MDWEDLVVLTGNSVYGGALEPYFQKDYPIFGANQRGAALELDRGLGCEVMKDCGIPVIPYETFTSYDKAIDYVMETKGTYACKPWGGTSDKSLSFVSSSPAGMIGRLESWRRLGRKPSFMMQKKIKGIEMCVAGWFGPGGWSEHIHEAWEHKKFLCGDLGCNTSEMGTVNRYVKKSKLFDMVVKPLTDYLHRIRYVGNLDVNCMIDEEGTPWPLEFTSRFGWPDFNLCMALHEGDPAEWMLDLLEGRDTLRVKEGEVCVGVVMTHGDFPQTVQHFDELRGYPLKGLTIGRKRHVALNSVMMDTVPLMSMGEVVRQPAICTAGTYVAVVTGVAPSVREAKAAAYEV